MIYSITGILIHTDVSIAVVECGGVGFKCFTTMNTLRQIGKTGEKVTLFTHLHVREDAMDLFGFYDQVELDCFKLLTSVSGVGPKAALSILSELTPDKLSLCIASGDSKSLTKAQGIGKKIAERIVLELKDKITASVSRGDGDSAVLAAAAAAEQGDSAEAVSALVALGFAQTDAAVVVGKLEQNLSVEEMIRQGLKILSRQV